MTFEPAVFEVEHLDYSAGGQTILSDVSLKVLQGEYCAVIGPNGGGKTTLVRLLLGLQKPTSGRISLFGEPQKQFRQWAQVGYVPQQVTQTDRLFPGSVEEIVRMGRISGLGWDKRWHENDRRIVERAMERMEVTGLRQKLVGELSGGQRQRVMIARALASEPKVLILDEPNTGVDQPSQQRFYALLRQLNQEERLTILFVTHDVGVIADDIARVFTVNQRLSTCNDPKTLLSCEGMSELYGIDAHLLSAHHRH
ncbi:metal ABC transporter ATP-binding protein [Sulfurimonas sp. HSL-3221]|uniref:metal ABC transporter ATP-binding protein n=1 Tax=Sulfurimonadaceae TaxID=2771471 RepID=UPI001E397ECC|nr:metal ABC transporter ATP-binding protein [Sulfurimonas sp. HSL-3221]UFS62473.1 metal ABC transporter ATP-binding protein [Sulfurimonas sp. HSL-3221]